MFEVLLTNKNINLFAHMIPEIFLPELQDETLIGIGGMDEYHDDQPVAVMLCRIQYGWMEIVWLCTDSEYRDIGYARDLMYVRLAAARQGGRLYGAFLDLPDEGDAFRRPMESIVEHLGFEMREVSYPVYSAALAECEKIEVLRRPISFHEVVPLKQAEDSLLKDAVREIQNDNRSIPFPQPIRWEMYDQQLSGIFVRKNKPVSLLLVSKQQDTITIRCAWSSDSVGIAVLLSYALQTAITIYPKETMVDIPSVSRESDELVKKIFPNTEPLKTTQARIPFSKVKTEDIF